MKKRGSTIAFILLLAALALFVWKSSAELPPIVASHFTSNGTANGFMPRRIYVAISLLMVVVMPLVVAFLPAAMIRRGGSNLNIPNREYWLAPERREGTVDFIREHGLWFAAAVALFLGYVHWLVVGANALHPPELSAAGMRWGMAVFFVGVGVWMMILFARFRRPA